jgi:RNA polymerase sigma-70 factor (ECF subfamily)
MDMVSRIRIMIDKLPELQRTIIRLRDVEGLEMNEISEITGFR